MSVSKVQFDGNDLINLENDTVTASNVLSGKTFHKTDGSVGTGSCTYDADTSDATAVASNIDSGKTAYVNGSKVTGTSTKITPSGNKAITATTATQTDIDVTSYATVSVAPTPSETGSATPSETAQTVSPSSGKLLSSVSVGAVSSSYVGSAITRRTSSDLTASGATVTVPSGYYSASASKAVASGTQGTPTATKTISNHTATVTPSCTDTTGYISGTTKSGTAVTVSASELVSDTLSITANGETDVTDYEKVNVNVPTSSVQSGTVTRDSHYNLVFSVTGTPSMVLVYFPDTTYSSSTIGLLLKLPSGYCIQARYSHSYSVWTAYSATGTVTIADGTCTCVDGTGFGFSDGTYNWVAW